jgi:hypothetical protein
MQVLISLNDQYFVNFNKVSKMEYLDSAASSSEIVEIYSSYDAEYKVFKGESAPDILLRIIEQNIDSDLDIDLDVIYYFFNENPITEKHYDELLLAAQEGTFPSEEGCYDILITISPKGEVFSSGIAFNDKDYNEKEVWFSSKVATSPPTMSDTINAVAINKLKTMTFDPMMLGDEIPVYDIPVWDIPVYSAPKPVYTIVGEKDMYYPTPDPIKNYETLKEKANGMETKLENVQAGNRTLAIVYGSKDSPSDFKERATRLVGSLNTPETIKVIVITVNGGRVFSGLDFSQPQDSGVVDRDMLNYLKQKFVQVLEVKYGLES